MNWPVEPMELLESVRSRLNEAQSRMRVYWFAAQAQRKEFASRMIAAGCLEAGVVPLVIRGPYFENPNELFDDLVRMIRESQSLFLQMQEPLDRVALVLIAVGPLEMPQICSPVALPDWFPLLGGQTYDVQFEDLSRTVDAPLNSRFLGIDALASSLYAFDQALFDRFKAVAERDLHAGDDFLQRSARRKGAPRAAPEFIDAVERQRAQIASRTGFRPAAAAGDTVAGRLWAIALSRSLDELPEAIATVVSAFSLTDCANGYWESIWSVVLRPPRFEASPAAERLARNALITNLAACQLLTSAAHAGDYQAYPVELLRALAIDLKRSLGRMTDAVAPVRPR